MVGDRWRVGGLWRSLIEGAVWSVGVVVVDVVGDESFELTLVPDDGAVEGLSPKGPDSALGECVRYRRSDWGLHDLGAFGSEDLVEGVDELASTISDRRMCIGEPVGIA